MTCIINIRYLHWKKAVVRPADKILRVLVHFPVVWELQFIFKDSEMHIAVIVSPEWSLPQGLPNHIYEPLIVRERGR